MRRNLSCDFLHVLTTCAWWCASVGRLGSGLFFSAGGAAATFIGVFELKNRLICKVAKLKTIAYTSRILFKGKNTNLWAVSSSLV